MIPQAHRIMGFRPVKDLDRLFRRKGETTLTLDESSRMVAAIVTQMNENNDPPVVRLKDDALIRQVRIAMTDLRYRR